MLNIPEVWVGIAENEMVRKEGSCRRAFSKARGCGLPRAGANSGTLVCSFVVPSRSCHPQPTPLDVLGVHQVSSECSQSSCVGAGARHG